MSQLFLDIPKVRRIILVEAAGRDTSITLGAFNDFAGAGYES
jgi:hypothetical protein